MIPDQVAEALLSVARELLQGDDAVWQGRRIIWKQPRLLGTASYEITREIKLRDAKASLSAVVYVRLKKCLADPSRKFPKVLLDAPGDLEAYITAAKVAPE